jgi:hypothetical protein
LSCHLYKSYQYAKDGLIWPTCVATNKTHTLRFSVCSAVLVGCENKNRRGGVEHSWTQFSYFELLDSLLLNSPRRLQVSYQINTESKTEPKQNTASTSHTCCTFACRRPHLDNAGNALYVDYHVQPCLHHMSLCLRTLSNSESLVIGTWAAST